MVNAQEKYRALCTAKEGELEELQKQIEDLDKNYLPKYHIAPKTGHLNDPNGLVFDGEKYHLFYQWFPFGPIHGMKHWKYLITKDFIHFTEGDVLEPDNEYESHGIYSGGAILHNGFIYCFYSGNVRDDKNGSLSQNQNIAKYSTDGKLLKKWNILEKPPEGYTGNFRDPSPFVTKNNEIQFLVGAQRENLTGATLLYKLNSWEKAELIGEVEFKNVPELTCHHEVYMHECPDLSSYKNHDILLVCPMGLPPSGTQYNNIFSALALVGRWEINQFFADSYTEIDHGFDFYAPQTFSNSERNIMLGWCGNGSLDIPTQSLGWKFMLTMPRELYIKDGRLYQKPLNEFQALQSQYHHYLQSGNYDIPINLSESHLLIENICNQPVNLSLFNDGKYRLMMNYVDGEFELDRTHTIQTKDMKRFGSVRQINMQHLDKLEIFIDRSIIEIFINDGEYVMTSRFFIPERNNNLIYSGNGNITISKMSGIHL